MSTTTPTTPAGPAVPDERATVVDKAQYGLAAFLVLVGGALLLLGVLLAVATARGDRPEAEEGEDVDLSQGTDLRTIGLLTGVLVLNLLLIDWLGWAITGALLFAGATYVLGSRTWVRNLAIGAALSVGSWYGFYVGLGLPIPAGILDGVL